MAFIHGKDTVVTVDGNDLSAFTKSSEYSTSVDSHDVTVYGATGHAYQGGLTDGTWSLEGIYDDGATSPRDVLQPLKVAGATVPCIRQPEGAGSGLAQDSFSGLVIDYNESNPVDDMITWTAEIQISGAVTSTAQV